jgi:hypothetical protein
VLSRGRRLMSGPGVKRFRLWQIHTTYLTHLPVAGPLRLFSVNLRIYLSLCLIWLTSGA